MKHRDFKSVLAWLNNDPTLKELCQEFPDEWQRVENGLSIAFSTGKPSDVQAYLQKFSFARSLSGIAQQKKNSGDSKIQTELVSEAVCYQMARKTVQQHYVAIASGVESGKVRFNMFNALLAQMLLFEHDLIRKPVSLFWFRLLWPILWQRRFLMPLVQPKGIYCFYSQELIEELQRVIGSKSCLEIAAGDGTLSRFLFNQGVNVTATDDGSWSHSIQYPETVIKLDAKVALRNYEPQVVLCSWPPANNGFEKQIFVTKSVQQYIMIGSRHAFAAGNWDVYRTQSVFSFEEVPYLSRLVVPPELEAAVYVFTRKANV